VTSRHEGISSIGMVFGMSCASIIGWGRLKTGDGFTKLLNCRLGISLILFFVIFLKEVLSFVVEL
jgi:hypothetical protein